MKKILLTLAALPAATMAVEASAQTYVSPAAEARLETRIMNLEARLNAGVQAGVINSRERSVLAHNINQLRSLERQYSANGLTDRERRALQQRIRAVRDQLRTASGSWGNQYGWNDRDLDAYATGYGSTAIRVDQYGRPVDQYGRVIADTSVRVDQYGRPVDQYGRVIANTGVRVDQYGRPVDQYGRVVANPGVAYDQYGRPVANGYYGQGGPYEPVQQNSTLGNILGGVLGSMTGGNSGLGGILGGGGLSVGSIISSAILGQLSRGTNYGYQDRSNVYFRSDGRQVYEIDARTNRVVRIHPIQ